MGGVGRGDHGGGKDMKKHIRNYLRHHGYGEQDTILCEKCGKIAVDIHHKQEKSTCAKYEIKDKDAIENLIALCRDCHNAAHRLQAAGVTR